MAINAIRSARIKSQVLGKVIAWVTIGGIASLVVPRVAKAQDAIEASATEFTYECQLLNDAGPGLRTVYLRHSFNIGSTASRFKLALSPTATMTYVSEAISFASVAGNTQSGISVCYGPCVDGTILIGTVTYMSAGTDGNCSQLNIVAHPNAETVEILRCDGTPRAAYTRDLHILAPFGTPCDCPPVHLYKGTPKSFDCTTVAVRKTTWGQIKALYRD